jgi:hypothetical protein
MILSVLKKTAYAPRRDCRQPFKSKHRGKRREAFAQVKPTYPESARLHGETYHDKPVDYGGKAIYGLDC